MGADYERFLAILLSAGIPYKTDKSMEWVQIGKPEDDGIVRFKFDDKGKMTSEGWAPSTEKDNA